MALQSSGTVTHRDCDRACPILDRKDDQHDPGGHVIISNDASPNVDPVSPSHNLAEATVTANYPRALVEFAVANGAQRGALLRRSGLQPEDLTIPDARVSLARYVRLIEAAAELTGKPALALMFGAEVKPEDVSIVALIVMTSETRLHALQQMGRYARVLHDDGGPTPALPGYFAKDEEGLWLVSTDPMQAAHPRLAEIMLAQNICGARRVLGAPQGLLIHYPHPAPSYWQEFERTLGAPVVFDAKRFAVRISEELLTARLPTANQYVFGVLSNQADSLLKELESSDTFTAAVQRLLMPVLHTGDVSITTVASNMGVHQKTLYRRLKAEGSTFEQVLDGLRQRLAVSYLASEKISVGDTAYLVGFSDPAAFSRAFKRWTGRSPGNAQFRTLDG